MAQDFRFGVALGATTSRAAWVERCRRAEELGFDVIGVPDHLGMLAPFPAMMLAAEATERVRLNTFVLNAPFYSPALLAREAATVDLLTDGRVELGLGAGYAAAEFERAGIPFPSARERVDLLDATAAALRAAFADPQHTPRPAQPGAARRAAPVHRRVGRPAAGRRGAARRHRRAHRRAHRRRRAPAAHH